MTESQIGRNVVIGIISLIVLIWIIIPASLDIIRYKKLPKKGIYSIGVITHIIDDRHSAASVNFTFKYKNKIYTDFSKTDTYDRNLIGKRFFVLFLPNHPKTVKLLLDKPVPNDIENAPDEAWKQLP
ncbi:hypothetical protein L3049_00620 [Labilibaculum sp. DW002]|uniref:DUF3592 domain-containing protein n=1 Tax=Paralabilibaculum antarcticum TaxID=2912572 RepID=A0ABT5VMK5_9BACT|nr:MULTISPECIES: hypothetical protein [unclassified Labilibaculum]MBI9059448.1 hypothetical protein [Labilibaculum sp.]MDE5416490.1 hypothetical protein [Labilibaculum sp. DW002]